MAINKVDCFGETLIDLTTDTVSAADLLEGKTAHAASGETVIGTMPNNGSVDIFISIVSEETPISEGYHDGFGKVSISAEEQAKVIPGNIVKGVTILGVSGTADAGGDSDIDKMVDGSITSYEGGANSIHDYAFAYCSSLATVSLPQATSINSSAFSNCLSLTTVSLPQVTSMSAYAFINCSSLTTIDSPKVTSINRYAFSDCSSLTTVSLPQVTSIESSAFINCSNLTTFILRIEKMATLTNVNAFENTPINSGTGYIYVPKSIVDTYKSATNWSTYANQFRAIEDYPDICGE